MSHSISGVPVQKWKNLKPYFCDITNFNHRITFSTIPWRLTEMLDNFGPRFVDYPGYVLCMNTPYHQKPGHASWKDQTETDCVLLQPHFKLCRSWSVAQKILDVMKKEVCLLKWKSVSHTSLTLIRTWTVTLVFFSDDQVERLNPAAESKLAQKWHDMYCIHGAELKVRLCPI